jgi:hypothetical protein
MNLPGLPYLGDAGAHALCHHRRRDQRTFGSAGDTTHHCMFNAPRERIDRLVGSIRIRITTVFHDEDVFYCCSDELIFSSSLTI